MVDSGMFRSPGPLSKGTIFSNALTELTHYHRGRRGQSQIESGEESSKACHSELRQDSDADRSWRRRIPCLLDLQ